MQHILSAYLNRIFLLQEALKNERCCRKLSGKNGLLRSPELLKSDNHAMQLHDITYFLQDVDLLKMKY